MPCTECRYGTSYGLCGKGRGLCIPPQIECEDYRPKINVGVHISHCCRWHGCKYGDEDCPVVSGQVEQDFLCQDCMEELENEEYYKCRLKDIEEIKEFQSRKDG